jgi:hypothetical protein
MIIPDLGTEFFPSRIPDQHQSNKVFEPKKLFLSSRKYDSGCSSWIPDQDPDFLPIPDPRSRGQKGTGSRIRNTAPDLKSEIKIILFCLKDNFLIFSAAFFTFHEVRKSCRCPPNATF